MRQKSNSIKNSSIVIWGATGQSIMLEEILSEQKIKMVALFDNNKSVKSPFKNIPVFNDKELVKNYKNNYFTVAIGGSRGIDRISISLELMEQGLNPITLIHKSAYVSPNALLGQGMQILPMAKICPRVEIGDFSIINTGASVDHECKLGKGVHIAPNATLCGCIEVGDYSFVGANATVLPKLKIGKNVVIGAGAVVTKDVDDNSIIAGNPARLIR